MKGCDDARTWMARGADGSLDEALRLALAAHLASCAACRDEAGAQGDVASVLRSRPVATVPPGFSARVSARLGRRASWIELAEWRTWTWRLVPVAAALMLAAVLWSGGPASGGQAAASKSVALVDTDGARAAPEAVLWDSSIDEGLALRTVLTGARRTTPGEQRHD
jgi:anti-sigma factor RsiW